MVTHENRITRIEIKLNGDKERDEVGLCKQVEDCKITYIKMNAKMNAILWMFGIIIALGIASLVLGFTS